MYLTYVLLLSSSAHFHEIGNASLEYSPDIGKVEYMKGYVHYEYTYIYIDKYVTIKIII